MPKKPGARRIFKDRLKLFAGPNHLYYDENPIEFPMWKLPDCTWETNLRHKDRLANWIKHRGERILANEKAKEEVMQTKQLASFKDFLAEHLEDVDPDAAKDMSVREFVDSVQSRKAAEMREESEGQPLPRRKVRMYPNTKIPVQKVYRKDTHRD